MCGLSSLEELLSGLNPMCSRALKGQSSYAGLLVSNKVRRIWMTLTIADSFFSLSKMLDSSFSTVSCLLTPDKEMERKMGLLPVPNGILHNRLTCVGHRQLHCGNHVAPVRSLTAVRPLSGSAGVTRVLTFQEWLKVGQALSSPGPGTSDLCSV